MYKLGWTLLASAAFHCCASVPGLKPAFQKKGIAKKLMNCEENWAKQKGYNQLASDTALTNSGSIDFHKQIGFAETERIVCFIKDL